MTFVEWLREQAINDVDREQPYAGLYELGPLLYKVIGDDTPSVRKVKVALDDKLDNSAQVAKHLGQFVDALAQWKLATVVTKPEPDPEVTVETGGTLEVVAPDPDHEMPVKALTGVLRPVTCGYRSLTGAECSLPSVPGSVRCVHHGGAITDPEVRSSLLLLSYAKLVEHTEVAVDALIDVAQNSRTDMARVQAAKELLDRAGITMDQHITVHHDGGEDERSDFVERMRAHLTSTRDRLQLVAIDVDSTEDEDDDGTEIASA